MRIVAAALAAAALTLAHPAGAAAQNYPWCMVKSEARTCGYTSFEQCMALRSVSAFCEQNFLAHPGPDLAPPRRSRR